MISEENQGGLGVLMSARAEITSGLAKLRDGHLRLNGATAELHAEVDRLRRALNEVIEVTTSEPDAVEAATRASNIAYDALYRTAPAGGSAEGKEERA